MSKIGIIIQARTGSTRLPNKMILPFYNEKGVLELLIERIKNRLSEIEIVVATTSLEKDNRIEEIADKTKVTCFRGDENDVLNRFICAAKKNDFDKIIRICADNPFLDMDSLVLLINRLKESSADYIAFSTSENIPTMKTHYGFWAEGVTLNALEKAHNSTQESLYREHVTNYLYRPGSEFVVELIQIPAEIENRKDIRLTLDTNQDFEMQKNLFEVIYKNYPEFNINNVINIVDNYPDYLKMMSEQISQNSK